MDHPSSLADTEKNLQVEHCVNLLSRSLGAERIIDVWALALKINIILSLGPESSSPTHANYCKAGIKTILLTEESFTIEDTDDRISK